MKTYNAQWFQWPSGKYLSADESFNNIAEFKATDLESAIEIAKEKECADSEIYFESRVSVWEVK